MTNEEIDIRLKDMARALPHHAKKMIDRSNMMTTTPRDEMELMNMSLMTIWVMLGEIAKRLPEPK